VNELSEKGAQGAEKIMKKKWKKKEEEKSSDN